MACSHCLVHLKRLVCELGLGFELLDSGLRLGLGIVDSDVDLAVTTRLDTGVITSIDMQHTMSVTISCLFHVAVPQVKDGLATVTERLQAEGDRMCLETDTAPPR